MKYIVALLGDLWDWCYTSIKKHYKSVLLFLLIFWVWKLYEDQLMKCFDIYILPLMSSIEFSAITNAIFTTICIIIICCLFSIYKKRYYIPEGLVAYGIVFICEYAKYRIKGNYVAYSNIVLGLGYTDIFIILFFALIVIVTINKFRRLKNHRNQTENVPSTYILDSPIVTLDEDIFDYGIIAQDVVDRINNMNSQVSCSIGLIAPWGMGKTSFLNILESKLPKEQYITIKFNPRHSYDVKSIQRDFFDVLYSTLSEYDSRFTSSFKKYLKSIDIISDNDIVSRVFNVYKVWNKAIEKKDVNDAIKRIDKRIVVIIDDFDRLVREEILEIFKLIDGNASFTNIIFISAYDKDYVNHMIDLHPKQQQASFSDKFFTIEIPLPPRPYEKIYNYLLTKLSEGTNASTEEKEEYERVLLGNINILENNIKTLRDVKRFLNLFLHSYTKIKEEVLFKDYFLLTIVKLKHISEYNKLYHKDYVHCDILKHSERYTLIDNIECESKDILNMLFGETAQLSYRTINNKSAFHIYFYESVYGCLEIGEMKQILTMPDITEVYKYIENLDDNKYQSFLSYIEYMDILSFPNYSQFERYIDIVMYLISTNKYSFISKGIGYGLIFESTYANINKKYNIQKKEYKKFVLQKLKGKYPYYPHSLVKDIAMAIINDEIHQTIILQHEDILGVACGTLENLIANEPEIKRQHINLLYNCIEQIDSNTHKITLNKDMCRRICTAIKREPQYYFSNFVFLGATSSSPDYNTIACEPFWEQIFESRTAFEQYLDTLNKEHIDNIELIKNFWQLYKNNDYTQIEFSGQGNVQDKIDNNLKKEVRKLERLLEIKKEFEDLERDRLSSSGRNSSFYQHKYNAYLNMFNNIGLHIKLTGELRANITNKLAELSK